MHKVEYREVLTNESDNTKLVFKDLDNLPKGELELLVSFEDQLNYTVGVVRSTNFKSMIKAAADNADNVVDDAILHMVMFWKKNV